MTDTPRYLLDVNVLIALLDEEHVHHRTVLEWFYTPGRQWTICAFTEAGLLRHLTRPTLGDLSMKEASAILTGLKQLPGYHYQPISADWQTLCARFSKRLFGHNQITDVYLLGMAVYEGLVLVTFDKAILHLAGEQNRFLLLLTK